MMSIVLSMASSAAADQQETMTVPFDASAEGSEPVEYSWRDAETRFHFGGGTLKLSNRIQLRGTDRRERRADADRRLDIPRARTEVTGWVLHEHFTYEVQFDWTDGPELQDLYVAADLLRRGALVLKVGQFKVPSSRQRLTSSGELQFVDRSIVASEFTESRDVGVQVSGAVAGDRVEYRVGMFNGAGQNTLARDGGFQYTGRVTLQPLGAVAYSEGDMDATARARVALGGSVQVRDGGDGLAAPGRVLVGADAMVLYRGASLLGELYFRSGDASAVESRSSGFLVQGGYFLVPRRLELAARFSTWARESWTTVGEDRELGVAIGYFLNRHNLKLQGDLRHLREVDRDAAAYEFRTQLQVAF